MNMGLALWLIFEFLFFCILYFWNFWVRFFFVSCIFEIFGSYIFLYFVFLRNCIRIYFVFFSYFLFFFVKIQKIQTKYQINTKNALCIFVFFVFFHYFQKCTLYFCIFSLFFHYFTDCTLSFCIFRSLDMPSKNKTANPPMYVVCPFCCWFCPLNVVFFCNLGLYFFGVFLMITEVTGCSQHPTAQRYVFLCCLCSCTTWPHTTQRSLWSYKTLCNTPCES